MMGRGHASCGFLVGAATLPIAPTHGLVADLAWVAALGGAAMLPDLDQGGVGIRGVHGSTIARLWGPLTAVPAGWVGKLAGGHRWGTHDALLGTLAFTAAAVIAAWFPAGRWLALALVIGLAYNAVVDKANGVKPPPSWPANLAVSWVGSALLIHFGRAPTWIPWVVAAGCLVHIAGDLLTEGGVPVPVVWIRNPQARVSLGWFTTGTRRERAVAWVATVAACGLLYLNEATVHSTVHAVIALGGSL